MITQGRSNSMNLSRWWPARWKTIALKSSSKRFSDSMTTTRPDKSRSKIWEELPVILERPSLIKSSKACCSVPITIRTDAWWSRTSCGLWKKGAYSVDFIKNETIHPIHLIINFQVSLSFLKMRVLNSPYHFEHELCKKRSSSPVLFRTYKVRPL